ncbi:hypothetical protein K7X08_018493 [Anisodus acutangulus]|uniref:Uncharacterized protein n=1 Tax=Anisodus acutangulus TaxID=402998 RepID=A0A9Q1R968_9SOLA|nr:hypothetical protein K7X08_018493 [Anisodus acutangulus]
MTSSFSCSRHQISSKSFWITPPAGSACMKLKARRKVVNARFDQHNRGGSKNVDENMIVLRMRIKELEAGKSGPSSNWMGWEKKYFAHYNEDVCEAIELRGLQIIQDNGGCGYFRWIDPSPDVELLKEMIKEVEEERKLETR